MNGPPEKDRFGCLPQPGINAGPKTACGGKGRERPSSVTSSVASNLLHPRDEHVGVDHFAFTSLSQSILFTSGTSPLGSKDARKNEGIALGWRNRRACGARIEREPRTAIPNHRERLFTRPNCTRRPTIHESCPECPAPSVRGKGSSAIVGCRCRSLEGRPTALTAGAFSMRQGLLAYCNGQGVGHSAPYWCQFSRIDSGSAGVVAWSHARLYPAVFATSGKPGQQVHGYYAYWMAVSDSIEWYDCGTKVQCAYLGANRVDAWLGDTVCRFCLGVRILLVPIS